MTGYERLRPVGPVPRDLPTLPPVLAVGLMLIILTILGAVVWGITHPASPDRGPRGYSTADKLVWIDVQLPTLGEQP